MICLIWGVCCWRCSWACGRLWVLFRACRSRRVFDGECDSKDLEFENRLDNVSRRLCERRFRSWSTHFGSLFDDGRSLASSDAKIQRDVWTQVTQLLVLHLRDLVMKKGSRWAAIVGVWRLRPRQEALGSSPVPLGNGDRNGLDGALYRVLALYACAHLRERVYERLSVLSPTRNEGLVADLLARHQ